MIRMAGVLLCFNAVPLMLLLVLTLTEETGPPVVGLQEVGGGAIMLRLDMVTKTQ